jgi:hypothetical protein
MNSSPGAGPSSQAAAGPSSSPSNDAPRSGYPPSHPLPNRRVSEPLSGIGELFTGIGNDLDDGILTILLLLGP